MRRPWLIISNNPKEILRRITPQARATPRASGGNSADTAGSPIRHPNIYEHRHEKKETNPSYPFYHGGIHTGRTPYRVGRPRYAPMHLASGLRGEAIWRVIGRPNYLKAENSRLAIPPRSCGAVAFRLANWRLAHQRYLSVKEEEASLLPARQSLEGKEVSEKTGPRENPFGISTF